MTRHANIVSFDEAKRLSHDQRGTARASVRAKDSQRTQTTSRSSRSRTRSIDFEDDEWTYERTSPANGTSTRPSARSRASIDGAVEQDAVERASARGSQRTSKREQRRRNKAKARAEKLFEKQNAAAARTELQDEGAPRAALYEGKMGSLQRKSARMQRSSASSSSSAKVNPAGWFANLSLTSRSVRFATIALCIVLLGAFLYIPAQQYYQAQREHDRLTAEYAVIEQRNEVLDRQNDSLASNAGMEDAVRQKYGYVKTGDQTAVVTGLSEKTTDSSRDGENIEANVLSSSVKAPEEWYTPILDAFFGVE